MINLYNLIRMFWLVAVSPVLGAIGIDLKPEEGNEKLNPSLSQVEVKNSEELNKVFKAKLLSLLGLKFRPRGNKNMPIPEYMLELYNQQLDSKVDFKIDNSANTVRSFFHEERSGITTKEKQINKQRFWFNISAIPENEQIKAAELRLYRVKSQRYLDRKKNVQVNIYEILHHVEKNMEVISRLIDTHIFDAIDSHWESFDVLPAVLRWKQMPHLNHGLDVHITFINGTDTNIEPIRLKRTADIDEKVWVFQKPFLVIYSDDGHINPTLLTRSKRNKRDNCRKHKLYVDFHDIGWDSWIIQPPGYTVNFCHGECSFIDIIKPDSPNHALLQMLVRSTYSDVPKLCCVPTKLSPISLIYIENNVTIYKALPDMIAEKCGCR